MVTARHSQSYSGTTTCRDRLIHNQSFVSAMEPNLNRLRSALDRMLQRTLPDGGHSPAKNPERLRVSHIAVDIAFEFLLPKFFVGSGYGGVTTPFVSMPETAVHENYRPMLWEHKVRRAGQISDMKSVSESLGEKNGTKHPFRPSVLAANARHHTAALRGGRNTHVLLLVPQGRPQKPKVLIFDSQSCRLGSNRRIMVESLACG